MNSDPDAPVWTDAVKADIRSIVNSWTVTYAGRTYEVDEDKHYGQAATFYVSGHGLGVERRSKSTIDKDIMAHSARLDAKEAGASS